MPDEQRFLVVFISPSYQGLLGPVAAAAEARWISATDPEQAADRARTERADEARRANRTTTRHVSEIHVVAADDVRTFAPRFVLAETTASTRGEH